jgi:hypothetical protein
MTVFVISGQRTWFLGGHKRSSEGSKGQDTLKLKNSKLRRERESLWRAYARSVEGKNFVSSRLQEKCKVCTKGIIPLNGQRFKEKRCRKILQVPILGGKRKMCAQVQYTQATKFKER